MFWSLTINHFSKSLSFLFSANSCIIIKSSFDFTKPMAVSATFYQDSLVLLLMLELGFEAKRKNRFPKIFAFRSLQSKYSFNAYCFFAFFVKCEIFAKYFWRNFASLSLFCFIHLVKKCEISRTCRNSNKNFRFFSRKVSFAVNPRWNTQGGPGHSHPPAVILRKLKKHWSQTVQFFLLF